MLGTAELRANTTLLGRGEGSVTMRQAGWIGAVQGLALPFRGFSRSGSTISTGMLAGATKERAERFSFALAVVLTPAVVGLEALRLLKASHEATASGVPIDLHASVVTSLLGMIFSFLAGLVALLPRAKAAIKIIRIVFFIFYALNSLSVCFVKKTCLL